MRDVEPANLNALPEFVHAADEDMYLSVLVAIADREGLDRRFAYGNIMDEYHECWFENYQEFDIDFEDVDLNERPDSDLVKSEYMVKFAYDDLMYYATHDPEHHVDHDITKPAIVTHETWGDTIYCSRCELDKEFAFEDELIALGEPERIRRVRAFLDPILTDDFKPYDVRAEYSVHYFHIYHNDVMIGSAQFNESLDNISVPLTHDASVSGLFLIANPNYEIVNNVLQRKDETK